MPSDRIAYPEDVKTDAYTAAGMIRRGGAIIPAAIGVGIGVKNVLSNMPETVQGFRTNHLGDTGAHVGNAVERMHQARQAQRAKVADKTIERFVEGLNNSGKVQEILRGSRDELNSKIAAIVSALDDPAVGGGAGPIREVRESLLRIMSEDTVDEKAARLISDTAQTIYETATDDGKRAFGQHVSKYERLKGQIEAPNFNVKSGRAFEVVDNSSELTAQSRRYLKELRGYTRGGAGDVQLLRHTESGGYYARVMSGNKRVADLVLQRGAEAVGNPNTGFAGRLVFTGEGLTTPRMPRFGYMPVQAAAEIVANSPTGQPMAWSQFQGAVEDISTLQMKEFRRQVRAAGGVQNLDGRAFREFSQANLPSIPKTYRGSPGLGGLDAAVQAAAIRTSQSVTLYGHGSGAGREIYKLRPTLMGSNGPFDAAVGHDLLRVGDASFGHLGVQTQHSAMQLLRGTPDRTMLPATARPEQVTKRFEAFIPPMNEQMNPVRSTLGFSDTYQRYGQNIEWLNEFENGRRTASLVGGANKITIMAPNDVTGLGRGEMYSTGKHRIRRSVTNTILDPAESLLPTSRLFKRLQQAGSEGINFTREEIRQIAREGWLGEGPSGAVGKKVLAGTEEMWLRASPEVVEGRTLWAISGYEDIEAKRGTKLFGLFGKSTMVPLKKRQMAGVLHNRIGLRAETIGVSNLDDVLVGDASMLKKGAYHIQTQMTTALGYFSKGRFAGPAEVFDYVKQVSVGRQRKGVNAAGSQLLNTLSGILPDLGRMSDEQVGLTLGGLWKYGHEHAGATQDDWRYLVEKTIRGAFPDRMETLIPEIRKGNAIAVGTYMPGPAVSEWGAARASMESRFFGMMHNNLSNALGMSRNEVNNIMAGLYSRKMGFAQGLEAMQSLTLSHSSILGTRMTGDMMRSGALPVVSHTDFAMLRSSQEMGEFLARHNEGFLLDFGEGEMGNLARRNFGNRSIVVSGNETLRNMRSASIKTATGDEVSSVYSRRLAQLSGLVGDLMQEHGMFDASHDKKIRQWVGSMNELFASVYKGLEKGKIEGSAYIHAATVRFGENGSAGFGQAQLRRMQGQFEKAAGHATWLDTPAFLETQRDALSAIEKELLAGGEDPSKVGRSAKEIRGKAFRRFFLGSEMAGNPMGNLAIGIRHPNLSQAHLAPGMFYRVSTEVMDDVGRPLQGDKAHWSFQKFKNWMGTSQAKAWIDKMEGIKKGSTSKLDGWHALAQLYSNEKGLRGAIDSGFQSFASELLDFSYGEGAGTAWSAEAFVEYKGKPMLFSAWAGAGGDADGDKMGVINMYSRKIMERMGLAEGTALRGEIAGAARYNALASTMARDAVSEGLANYAAQFPAGVMDPLTASIQKEQIAKGVGSVSTVLGAVREGAYQSAGTKQQQLLAQQLTAFLYGLEEAPGIAAKHSKTPTDMGLVLVEKIRAVMNPNGDSAAAEKELRHVLKNVFFKDTDIFTGYQGEAFKPAKGTPEGVAAAMSKGLEKRRFALTDELIDFFIGSARYAGREGLQAGMTEASLAQALNRGGPEALKAIEMIRERPFMMMSLGALEGVEAASSGLREVGRVIKSAARTMDSRMLGPAVLGIGAAMGIGAIMGAPGYSAEPLLEPGEDLDPRVAASVAAGGLFNQGQKDPGVEGFANSPRMNLMDRPINPSTTYTGRRNAYQIRGSLRNMAGLGDVSSFMNRIGGSTSIRINDTRKPLTPNYIDRITSE
jgi:hypothetical protein